MKNNTDLSQLIEKYVNNTCTPQELDLLLEHLSTFEGEKSLVETMDRIWQQQESLTIYSDDQKNKLFQTLLNQAQPGKKHVLLFKNYSLLKFAATLLLLAVAVFLVYEFQWIPAKSNKVVYLEKENRSGQKSTITLPDGSVIRLNSESKLTYPEKFDGDTRTLTLEGEAFFTVTPNPEKPFIVKTMALTTTVLGTSFNIKAFPDENTTVTVTTGKVNVEAISSTSEPQRKLSRDTEAPRDQSIVANQQTIYNVTTGQLKVMEVDAVKYSAWTDGWLVFDNEPLREVMKVLERWYGMPIIISDEMLKNKRVTLKQQGESLHTLLRAISYAGGFTYSIDDNKVIIEVTNELK